HSPFAEWRLFLRGLAAQRRGDKDTVEANWSRLDANRRPAKVVAKIRGLSTDSAAPGGGGGKSLEQIERSLYGGSVTGLLRSVRQDLVADELERFFEQMPVLVRRLASVDSKFPQRLTEILLRDVVQVANELEHDSARRFVKDFIKVAQPVSYDPKFDRLQALVPQSGGGFDGTLKHWRNFRNGVRDAAPFSPADRRRLEAMILRHMSEGWATKAQLPEELLELGVDSNAATTPDKCWTEARAVLEESIELDPTARKSYQALWDLVLKTPDTGPEALVTVAERTLKAFPGDLDSLRFLIDHYYVTEDSQRGKEYVEELRRRVPLEVEGLRSEIRVRYLLARDAALSGDFETGRSHLAAAEQLWDEIDRGFAPLARRAIFEFRAGEIARAEALVKEAFNASKAKLPVILELAINAARYDLPVMLCARFDRELQVESRKKVTAESAAHSAMAMHAVLTFRRGYPTRQTHVDATAAHVLRSSRVKFSQDQFEAIGEFLRIAGTPDKDQLKILHRAQREFPWAPSLVVQEIEMERAKPPGKWNVNKLITLVNHAIVLADRSTEKEDKEVLLPELRDMLEALRFIQLKNSKMGNPGRKGRSMDVLESMFENFMGGFEDSASGYDPFGFDDDEDDESAAGNFGSPFPRPARKKAPPRKGR
ncbi:MAG: hypothetical protein NT069_12445, partial [Planctomycetota bacterium]|nr:hypothetical protein [Planctomycetota bacterium]